jgi:ketosteroid isomerase-like protein
MRAERRSARTATVGVTVLVCATVGAAAAQGTASDEAAVRAARAQSNAAIAAHDMSGITRHWMPNVHVVTSTSAQGSGREVNADRMALQFKRRPDTIYVRTPSTIAVFTAWHVASEHGEWTGRWTEPDGVVNIGGTYLAQWRKVDGTWLIQSELFVPTSCRGSSYCARHP